MTWLLNVLLLVALVSAPVARGETLLIGAEDDWFPYTAQRGWEPVGYSVDLVRAAFAAADQSVDLRSYPYSRCMQLAKRGELVACFNTTPNEQIKKDYLLPKEPLFSDEILLWARQGSVPFPSKTLPPLTGKRIAVTIGYEYGPDFDARTDIARVAVRKDLYGFQMLARRRVDYVVAFAGTAASLFVEHPELTGQFKAVAPVYQAHLFISFSRQHPEAAKALRSFEQGFKRIKENGEYQRISQNWAHQSGLDRAIRLDSAVH